MNSRKKQLLQYIIESYISRVEPVGSKFLVESTDIGVSGATVRNEMRDLEKRGYLVQPHASAGRIPTETAYQYYVQHIMKPEAVEEEIKQELKKIGEEMIEQNIKQNIKMKSVGKYLTELTQNAVIIALNRNNVYYTGISNLFSQPEFQDYAHVVNFSAIFDQCEEKIEELFDLLQKNKTSTLIGSQNPFGSACSTIAKLMDDNMIFSLVGPMRMDYSRNVGLVNSL